MVVSALFKKAIGLILITICGSISILAQSKFVQEISSPDRKTSMAVSVDSSRSLKYVISFQSRQIVGSSPLGLVINGADIGTDVEIIFAKRESISQKFKWPLGESNEIDNTYNELLLACKSGDFNYHLVMRLFDGSVAFRYLIPEQTDIKNFVIKQEKTTFNLGKPYTIYQYHHESVFNPVLVDSLSTTCDLPATLSNGMLYLSIGEAANINYTKAELQRSHQSNGLGLAFARDAEVKFSGPFETPWRTISFSNTAIGLHKFSQLFLKLNPPPVNVDLEKIIPGKLIRAQLNTQSGIDCIDFARKLDFKYIMFDAGWYGPERARTSDPRLPIAALDLQKVIDYGKEHGIGVILYVNYIGLQDHLDEILPLYKRWGIAGMKFGFIDGFSQKGLTWLSSAVSKVNDHGLLLNIHDNYKPTGISRTYPYLLTQEGIRGDENSPDAFHTTTLPFTRFLAGAADFTFCFPNSKNSFSKNIKVSKAQQLALTVVNFSPLQAIFWYGQPKDYTNFEELEFFKYVPTVWDESHYLGGDIGKNISVARRKGQTWYIGNAAGFSDWEESLKLDFLEKKKTYRATIYEDGLNGEIVKRLVKVKRRSKLPINIKGKGGQAIMLEPI